MNPDDQIGLFPHGRKVYRWHPLIGQRIGERRTLCGHWPDTFATYALVRPVEHAFGGGRCARISCRCYIEPLPMCKNCERLFPDA